MRRIALPRRRADAGPATRPRNVQPLTLRQNRVGQAARWVVRQGPVSLALHVAAFTAFVVAGFTVLETVGWVVLGGCCLWLEALTREDRP